jgi:hypothetical protein
MELILQGLQEIRVEKGLLLGEQWIGAGRMLITRLLFGGFSGILW